MKKKHLIQLVANLGAGLVFYVLSYALVWSCAFYRIVNSNEPPEIKIESLRNISDLYKPVVWLLNNSDFFKSVYEPYDSWCFGVAGVYFVESK